LVPEKPSAFWMCGRATLMMVPSSTTISWAVAVAFDAAAVLTTGVGGPVFGVEADKTISLERGAP
jgi:hypothetical protein